MNVAFTRAAEGLPRRAFTVEEIRRMVTAGVISEDENIELVEGEIVVMASKGYAHELIKIALNAAILRALPNDLTLGPEMTLQFGDSTLLEPDLAVFKRGALIKSDSNFAQISPGGLLLAIEVAASSLAYDKGLKARLYANHGVAEFWVIEVSNQVAWIHSGPAGDGWTSMVERGPDEVLTTPALPAFAIRLSDIE